MSQETVTHLVSSQAQCKDHDKRQRLPVPVVCMCTDKASRSWLTFDRTNLVEHVEVVGIYVLCPLLYGHAHQSDNWLKWCYEVGILTSDR